MKRYYVEVLDCSLRAHIMMWHRTEEAARKRVLSYKLGGFWCEDHEKKHWEFRLKKL